MKFFLHACGTIPEVCGLLFLFGGPSTGGGFGQYCPPGGQSIFDFGGRAIADGFVHWGCRQGPCFFISARSVYVGAVWAYPAHGCARLLMRMSHTSGFLEQGSPTDGGVCRRLAWDL